MSLFVFGLLGGCTSSQLSSISRQTQIEIDGEVDDWETFPVYSEREGIRLSITNDREYLYLLFATQQRDIARQILMRGLTLWFDPNGGDKKTIGVSYPLGVMEAAMRNRLEGRALSERMDMRDDAMNRSLLEFEFYGPQERDRVRVIKTQGQGIEIELNDEGNLFIYEAKIPLVFSMRHPYAIETSPGSTIGLTIEVGSRVLERGIEGGGRPDGVAPPGGGFPGGGRGGRGRMGEGGMRSAAMQGTAFEPIELRVRLAE